MAKETWKYEGEQEIVCMYGTFEPGEEYEVSPEVGKALEKIPGFNPVRKNNKKKEVKL